MVSGVTLRRLSFCLRLSYMITAPRSGSVRM